MQRPKRVLRILNRLNIGGPTFNASLLTRHLAPEFETLFLSGMIDETEASSEYIPTSMGLHPVYVRSMYRKISPVHDWRAYKEIAAHIRSFKPDIVHTHASKAGALGRLAAANHQVPVIVHTFHGNVLQSYFSGIRNKVFINIERYLAKKTTQLIAISEIQKREIAEKFRIASPEKITVVPLGFDLSKFGLDSDSKRQLFRERFRIPASRLVVTIVARFVPVKNLPMFLRVARLIRNQTAADCCFLVVGDGEQREAFEQLASELSLSISKPGSENPQADVVLTSWQTEMDLVYAASDVVVLTSLNEGTPVSLIEAQASGKPLVSTLVGGVEEIMLPDVSGFLVSVNDDAGFAGHLLKLIQDEALRKQLGEAGKAFVQNRFHYSRLVENTAALYNRLLASAQVRKDV
jgi:glycosyltransferase involved in cell wall biosynthesis